jgi:stage II sporulation protein D
VAAGKSITIDEAAMSSLGSASVVGLSTDEIVVLTPLGGVDQLMSIQRGPSAAHRYRGSVTIECLPSGSLRLINSLPLEQYLYGVVGPEIGPTAPLEALKAQAVAARTFAVKNFDTDEAGDADLEDTSQSQAYLGYGAERWAVRKAVDDTAGKILTYDGQPINAVYATDCGGVTAEGDAPYLKPVVDEDCAQVKPWTVTISLADLLTDLERAGVKGLDGIGGLSVGVRDSSGRVTVLTVTGAQSGNFVSVPGETVRRSVGYDKLRSTLFDVSIDSAAQTCTFVGHGWGHGLGMCQRGAVFMARSGAATYDEILTHYYTGVEITDLTSDFLQQDDDSSRDEASAGQAPTKGATM